jgi:hypothetical protein
MHMFGFIEVLLAVLWISVRRNPQLRMYHQSLIMEWATLVLATLAPSLTFLLCIAAAMSPFV